MDDDFLFPRRELLLVQGLQRDAQQLYTEMIQKCLHKTVLQYAERLLKGPCSRQALSVKLIEVRLAVVRICKTEVQQGPTCLSRSGCCRV